MTRRREHGADLMKASGNDPKHPLSVFKPSAAQMRYLLALEAALTARQSVSDTAIAKALKMSRTTIWEWKHDPQFAEWLRTELGRTSDDLWPLVVRRHELLAIQGSVRSAEFVLKVRLMSQSAANRDDPGDAKGKPYIVNILVPRPPDMMPADGSQSYVVR